MAKTVRPRPGTLGYAAILRDLNAAFRRTVPVEAMRLTPDVLALPEAERAALIEQVRQSGLDPDGGPQDDGGSGTFWWNGRFCSWLIVEYDLNMQYRSPDPTDPAVTHRVLIVDSIVERG